MTRHAQVLVQDASTPAVGRGATLPLRRAEHLPPYPLAQLDEAASRLRRSGRDVIDIGFGSPDIPPPEVAMACLAGKAQDPRAHGYSPTAGVPRLRAAAARLYRQRFGVEVDPDREVEMTLGAKEGLAQLMQILLDRGDIALVPGPSYPSHRYAPRIAGAGTIEVPVVGPNGAPDTAGFLTRLERAWETALRRPRVLLLSFPHNPTAATVDLDWWERIVRFVAERELVLVHDFAYADIAFGDESPPSVLQVPGAREVAVELYTLSKSYSMAGWRVAFAVGSARLIAGLHRVRCYQDYGAFGPIQEAAAVALEQAPDFPREAARRYEERRDVLCAELARYGWLVRPPAATMFAWARIPVPFRHMGSLEFSRYLLDQAGVAVSPGSAFGPDGEGYVRIALVQDAHLLRQAAARIGSALRPAGAAQRVT